MYKIIDTGVSNCDNCLTIDKLKEMKFLNYRKEIFRKPDKKLKFFKAFIVK